MRETQRTVFYCDFCRKHGLARRAMELHERICTMNPDRTCRWSVHDEDGQPDTAALARVISRERAKLKRVGRTWEGEERFATHVEEEDVAWLRGEVAGCPACMLAVLRQSRLDDFHFDARGVRVFDYQTEVDRVREEERVAAAGDW